MGDSVNFGFDIKDVQTLVDMYLTKESGKYDRLTQAEKSDEVRITLFGQLMNLVNTLKTNVDNVSQAAQTLAYTSSVDNSALLSATITSNTGLYAATHQINVTQLANNEVRQCANTVSTRNAALSQTGNLSFTIGASSFSVTVAATDTLENIRDNINNNIANVGVTASIVASTDGLGNTVYSLAVASDETGLANGFTVGGTLGGTGNTFDFGQEKSVAADAIFTFDSMNEVRSSNTIADVMDGVTFNLLATGNSKLTITSNQGNMADAMKKSIHTMVDSYNQIMSLINTNFAQTAADRRLNDETLLSVKNQLSSLFGKTLSLSPVNNLLALGVSLAPTITIPATPSLKDDALKPVNYYATGALKIDDTVLGDVLKNNLGDVISFFKDATNGFTQLADTAISNVTINTIPDKTTFLKGEVARLNKNIGDEQDRLDALKSSLIDKFSSLLQMVKQSEGMSNYLDKQFSVLNFKK